MTVIKSLSLVGYGRLAKTLAPALVEAGFEIVSWHVRNVSLHAEILEQHGIQPCTRLDQVDQDADLHLIMVPDDVIQPVSVGLGQVQGIVAHTSGATPIDTLAQKRCARFYPLVTFNGTTVWNREIPIIIQAEEPADVAALQAAAQKISNQVPEIDENKMAILHLAAVTAQNFSNHFIDMGERLLEEHHLDRALLHPLLQAMVNNLKDLPAAYNQTGPAVRGDAKTIATHRALMSDNTARLKLYDEVTTSIQRENAIK